MTELFPLVTVYVVLFTLVDWQLRVLIVKPANDSTADRWALPGSLVRPNVDNSLDDTALRVIKTEAGVDVRYLEQVITVSGPKRDPRGWSTSTVYYALLPRGLVPAAARTLVKAIDWRSPTDLQDQLAFDHGLLLSKAHLRLKEKVRQGALPLYLLSEKFTLTDLQRACEAVLETRLDKGAFRRRIKDEPSLRLLPGEFLRGPQRPAQLFQVATDFQFKRLD